MSFGSAPRLVLAAMLLSAAFTPLVESATLEAAASLDPAEPPGALVGAAPGVLVQVEGPDGSPMDVRVDVPVANVGGHTLLLGFPRATAAKLDPDLLNLTRLARDGLVDGSGRVPVLVRAALPLSTGVLEVTGGFARLQLVTGRVLLSDLPTLALDPGVERVFADGMNRPTLAESVPLVRADQVWQRTDAQSRPVNGTGVSIAILDTGVDHTHPDLGGCLGAGCKVVAAKNFAQECADATDDYGHGTHVAATAAGVRGVAPGASVLNYKVLCDGWGWDSWIIAGIENATLDGADIISMSLGGSGATDTPLAQAVDWAVGQGVVVVSAAGNWGCYGCVGEPATALRGIAVGATDKQDGLAWFSSRGPVYNATGAIAGIKPDLAAPGVGIVAAVPTYECPLCDPSGRLGLSGTSMATPHVSGAAALLLQGHPGWSPDDVKGALMGSAVPLPYDTRSIGTGRLDALGAYDARLSMLPGNAWLGIDISAEPAYNASLPVAVKNLANATLDVALAAEANATGVEADAAPGALSLAPGETVWTNLTLDVDNSLAEDGWHEGALRATGDATAIAKFTFVKSGVLRIATLPGTWFIILAKDGQYFTQIFYPSEAVEVLAPAGEYDLQALSFSCPEEPECFAPRMTYAFAEAIAHETVTDVNLIPETTHLSTVQPRFEDGSTPLPGAMPYCNWDASATGCYEYGWTTFSSPRVDYYFWVGGGDASAPYRISPTSWAHGRAFVYSQGRTTYMIGNATVGVHADQPVAPDAGEFLERGFRFETPPGWTLAMRMHWCQFDAWGLGTGRPVLAPRERVLTAIPDLPPAPTPWGQLPALGCTQFRQELVGSTDGSVGLQCWDGGDCWSLGASPLQARAGSGFRQFENPWSATPLLDALRGGDVVVQAGAQGFTGRAYAGPGFLDVTPAEDYAYNTYFAPASGGIQYLHQSYDSRLSYRLLRDGEVLVERNLTSGWSDRPIDWWGGGGDMRLEMRSAGSLVGRVVGETVHTTWWDGSSSVALPRVLGLHARDADGLATSFSPETTPEARFLVDGGSTLVDAVRVVVRNLDTGASVETCCVGRDNLTGFWSLALPDVGVGAIELNVSGVSTDGSVGFSLIQSPAYHVAPANTTYPWVAIDRPTDGEVVHGLVNVTGRAGPNGTVHRVEVRVDEGEWRTANGTAPWSSLLDARNLSEGVHRLEARVANGTGWTIASVHVLVDNVEEPPCAVDLVVESIRLERTPIETRAGSMDNDVAGRHVVRAVVANVGPCASWGFLVQGSVHADARVPGTTGGAGTREDLGLAYVEGLAPGQRAEVTFEWDATGNVGDQEIVVEADPWRWMVEADEANNRAVLETWMLVGGLGGVAVAPVPAPHVEP